MQENIILYLLYYVYHAQLWLPGTGTSAKNYYRDCFHAMKLKICQALNEGSLDQGFDT